MKTVADYIKQIGEDAAATNVVGDGNGAVQLKQTPVGAVQKRKSLEDKNEKFDSKDPLKDVLAPELEPESPEKKMFKARQNYQNDQVMSYD